MTRARKSRQKYAFKKEAVHGSIESVVDADFFQTLADGVGMELTREPIEYAVLDGNGRPSDIIPGVRNANISVPVHFAAGKVTGVAPKAWELLECSGFEKSVLAAQRDIATGSTTTVINLDDTSDLEIGHWVKVAGTKDFGVIKAIVLDTEIELEFALSAAPTSAQKLEKMSNYKWNENVDEVGTFVRDLEGDVQRTTLKSCRMGGWTIAMEGGGLATWTFSGQGLDYNKEVLGAPSGVTPAFNNALPAPILGGKLYARIDGVFQEFKSTSITVAYERATMMENNIGAENLKEASHYNGKYKLTATVNPYKEQDSLDWEVGTQLALYIMLYRPGASAGDSKNCTLISLPKLRISANADGLVEDLMTNAVTAMAFNETADDAPVLACS